MQSSSIIITPYQNIHQSGIDEMMQEIALEFDEEISSKPTRTTPLVPDAYWIALINEQVIGTIGIVMVKNEFAILKRMMLKKSFRGKAFGIAQQLLQTALDWCAQNNLNQIYLGTMNQFKAAQIFYEKNGFQRVSETALPNNFLTNPLDSVFYQRKLDAFE